MFTSITGFAAVILYVGGFCYLLNKLLKQPNFNTSMLQTLAGGAIVLHGLATVQLLFVADGLDLSLFRIFVFGIFFSSRKNFI